MKYKKFREYWPQAFELEEEKDSDEWWKGKLLIDGFNESCKNIAASYLKVGYELLGTEFKTVDCFSTVALILMYIKIGN